MHLAVDWDEEYVLSLPLGENDRLERKGTPSLDVTPGGNEGKTRSELAKQLSAFANTGGGQIVYGLKNDGSVDSGGVSETIRGLTKEWLEDLIPVLTEFEISGVNVYPIRGKSSSSKIENGKALFVIDVPDSDRAPHQSTADRLYYVRLGGKSRPAPHRLIEDIRNRAKHPRVDLIAELDIHALDLPVETPGPLSGRVTLTFKIRLRNMGFLKSQNTCFYFELNWPSANVFDFDNTLVSLRRAERKSAAYWEVLHPLYPGMDILVKFNVDGPISLSTGTPFHPWPFWTVDSHNDLSKAAYQWTLFADSAPMKTGQGTLGMLQFDLEMYKAVGKHPKSQEIFQRYPGLSG